MEENGVKEVLKPDNANVGRGLVLVLLAAFLGLFLSIQVVGQGGESASETETAGNATTTSVFTSQLTTPQAPSTSAEPAAPVATDPEEVELDVSNTTAKVFNGSRARGIATKGTQLLTAAGYKTATPGDTPDAVQTSTILYEAGFEEEAKAVADLLDAADETSIELLSTTNQPVDDVSGIDVVIVVGRDGLIPL